MTTSSGSIVWGKDVMNPRIISIDGMATAKEAAAKMREEKVHSLLVNKRHTYDAWGIVPVPADMDIRYIARLLHRVGMRRAPVEENGQLIGMVTLSSLVLDYDLFE